MSDDEKKDAPCFWAQAIKAGLLSENFQICWHPDEPRTLVPLSYCERECPRREPITRRDDTKGKTQCLGGLES